VKGDVREEREQDEKKTLHRPNHLAVVGMRGSDETLTEESARNRQETVKERERMQGKQARERWSSKKGVGRRSLKMTWGGNRRTGVQDRAIS